MSRFVDERVVEMSFDNKRFESNVKTSMGTIDKLKDSLDFSGTANSINRELNGINANGISTALVSAKNSFTTFEIASIAAIANITNKIVDMGIAFVKSLSIDQISSGWTKFSEMAVSEATLLAQGYDQLEVTDSMENLLWFTDETSYSFSDMMSNMSKFTAAGVELEDAQKAMMGIANWAALSGQNSDVASRAMYQLSQAMGSGVVKLNDWRSIETANMATEEFKNMILDTASSMGTLVKNLDGTYTTMNGKNFKAGQFREFLSEGFLTTEVLTKTLESYSNVAMKVQKMMDDDSSYKTASKALGAYEQQINELEASISDLLTAEEKAEIQAQVDAARFGIKAFRAAQEARTFSDAIKAVKDAVSTGWTKIFSNIFGQVEEAKKLWTDLANSLYDVFMDGMWTKIDILGIWAENGGRNDLFENTEENTGAFWNLFNAIVAIKDLIGGAWSKVFGLSDLEDYDERIEDIAGKLKTFTERLKEITAKLTLSSEASEVLTNIFTGLFSVIKLIGKTVISVWNGMSPLLNVVKTLMGYLFVSLGSVGKKITDFTEKTTMFEKIAHNLQAFFITIIDGIKTFVDTFNESMGKVLGDTKKINIFKKIIDLLSIAFMWLGNVLNTYVAPILPKVFDMLARGLGWLFGHIIKFISKTSEVTDGIKKWASTNETFQNGIITLKSVLSSLGNVLKNISKKISDFFKSLGKENTESLDEFTDDVEKKFNPLKSFLSGLIVLLEGLWHFIKAISAAIGSFFRFIGTGLKFIGDKIKEIFTTGDGDVNFTKIFTVGFWALVLTGIVRFADALRSVTTVFIDAFDGMFDYINSKSMMQYMEAIKTMAISILLMVAALLILGAMDTDVLKKSMFALSALVGFIVGVMLLMKNLVKFDFKKNGKEITNTGSNLVGLGFAFLGLGSALLLMVVALNMLTKMDPDKMWVGIGAIVVMMIMLVVTMKVFQKSDKETNKAVKSMVKVAISIALLVVPLKKIGNIDTTTGIKGLIGIASLMIILGIYSKLSKHIEKSQKPIAGLLSTAIALTLLIIPLKVIGGLSEGSLIKTGAVLVAIFTIFILVNKILGKNLTKPRMENMSRMIWSLSALAIGLGILGVSMMIIGRLSVGSLIKTGVVLVAIFVIFIKVNKILDKKLTKARTENMSRIIWSLIPLSLGLLGFGLAIRSIADIHWTKILSALGVMTLVLLILSGISALMKNTGSGSWSLILIGVALIPLSVGLLFLSAALLALGSVPITTILIGLGALIGVFIALAIVGLILKPVILTILALVGTFFLFALGVFLLSAGLASLGAVSAAAVVAFAAALAALLGTILLLTPLILKVIWDLFHGILIIIEDSLPFISIIIEKLILELLRIIVAVLPAILDTLIFVIDQLIAKGPEIVDKLVIFLITIIDSLAVALEKSATALNAAIKNLLLAMWYSILDFFGIKSPSKKMMEVGFNLVAGLTKGLWDSVKKGASEIKKIFTTFFDGIKNFFKNALSSMKNIGIDLMNGLKNGIIESRQKIIDEVTKVANDVGNWFKKVLGIKSPSKVFAEYGKFLDLGLAKGIDDHSKVAYKAAEDLGDDTAEGIESSGLSKVLTDLNKSLESDFDNEIIIRPVLDLSEIQNGKNSLTNMMSEVDSYDISGSNIIASRTRDEFNRNTKQISSDLKNNSGQDFSRSEIINNTFNITGTNSKEIADEVSRVLQIQVDRRKAKWAL